jgi:membrane protein CcdC involved in cytochrome C biogenesis
MMFVRRFLSLLGMFVLLALALMLLWRVYLHHNAAEPYTDEETTLACAKFASALA